MQEGGEPAAEPAMKTDPTTNSTESVIQTPSIWEIVTSVVLKNYDSKKHKDLFKFSI